jgi:hypothetical protein
LKTKVKFGELKYQKKIPLFIIKLEKKYEIKIAPFDKIVA